MPAYADPVSSDGHSPLPQPPKPFLECSLLLATGMGGADPEHQPGPTHRTSRPMAAPRTLLQSKQGPREVKRLGPGSPSSVLTP